MRRTVFNEDHEAFRDTVRKVFAEHMTPYLDQHEEEGIVPRSAWKALGEAGMLCPTVAEENGGLGLDFGFNCVIAEELSYLGSSAGFTLQNDITVNYFERLGTEPLDDDLLEKRRLYMTGSYARALETSGGFNAIVATLLQQGLDPAEAARFAEQLDGVDADAANLAARTYVDPARATIVIVGDADQFLEGLKAFRENVEVVPASKLDLATARLFVPLESANAAGGD